MKIKTTIGAVIATAGVAAAQPAIISFTYSDLSASFDSGAAAYTAVADADTSGDVTRLDATPGSSEFDAGSLPGSFADAQIAMTISNIGAMTADGNGTVTLTDDNGDFILAEVNGIFRNVGGAVFYEGVLSNAFFIDVTSDNLFDGSTAGSFVTPATGPYSGSIVELFFNPGTFFAADFSDQTTLASGLLVPAPGTAALLAFGGLLAAGRRRG